MATASFDVLIRVRYAECDAQQVVFNSRYAEYADLAATEFMRSLVGGYTELVNQGFDNQVVNMNISWQSSAKFDDVIRMTVSVSNIGNTSFSLNIVLKEHVDDRPIATIDIVYVMVDAKSFTKIPVPSGLKEKLIAGPGVQLIDLAGLRDIQPQGVE